MNMSEIYLKSFKFCLKMNLFQRIKACNLITRFIFIVYWATFLLVVFQERLTKIYKILQYV